MGYGLNRTRLTLLLVAAALSVAAIVAEKSLTSYRQAPFYQSMVSAARTMEAAGKVVRARRLELGFGIDGVADPNGTGFIGVEYSGITTSLGDPAAKRTTTNPDMAAVMVALLGEAGVRSGDLIAVGASGSFPAATMATLAAARAMNLEVALIVSLGASNWGANIPGYSYLAMHEAAVHVLGYNILAVSLGGDGDSGQNMDPSDRSLLLTAMDKSGIYTIESDDDAEAVERRMELYDNFANEKRFSAFINVGGSTANIGSGMGALTLEPGVNRAPLQGSGKQTGVAFEMAARGVTLIHVLEIRRLALEHGLPWDPVPFPEIGKSLVYRVQDATTYRVRLVLLAIMYAVSLAVLGILARRTRVMRGVPPSP